MNESLDNNTQANPSGEEWEKAMQDFIGNFVKKKEVESTPHYMYSATDVEDVIQNAEEYIIPECLEACKKLWSKNIETSMCANYSGSSNLFIVLPGIDSLSDENQEIFKDNSEEGFILGEIHDNPEIVVAGRTQESVAALINLVDKLKIQDVRRRRYQTAGEFLEEYKYGDMPAEYSYSDVDERGDMSVVSVVRQYDPRRIDATLQDALEQTGKASLYVPSEGRIYESQMFLDWHNRYLESKDNNQ